MYQKKIGYAAVIIIIIINPKNLLAYNNQVYFFREPHPTRDRFFLLATLRSASETAFGHMLYQSQGLRAEHHCAGISLPKPITATLPNSTPAGGSTEYV